MWGTERFPSKNPTPGLAFWHKKVVASHQRQSRVRKRFRLWPTFNPTSAPSSDRLFLWTGGLWVSASTSRGLAWGGWSPTEVSWRSLNFFLKPGSPAQGQQTIDYKSLRLDWSWLVYCGTFIISLFRADQLGNPRMTTHQQHKSTLY